MAGHQYSKSLSAPEGGWDENWLIVSGRVKRGDESWIFQDPCLTTWEARELLAWLRRASESVAEVIDFTEPHVSFDASPKDGDETIIVVTLKGEAAPPSISDRDRWDVGCPTAFHISCSALAAAAGDWERELADFPVR